jgi:tetratricopeptide (TPR) repeat protein
VRNALPPSARGPLHAAVVEVLRAGAAPGSEVPVAEVAHHALVAAREGEDPQAAYELSLEAAREAGAVLAHAEAAGHYADALEALDALGAEASPAERAAALEGLAAATVAAGEIGGGRTHYRRAFADARRRADAAAMARAALGFAEFHRYGEIDHEAIDVLEQALAALPESDSPERARVAARLAVRLDPAAGTARREALVDEATAMARRLGAGEALTGALYASVLVNWRPQRTAERAEAAAEILALAPRSRNHIAVVWARMARFVDALEAGRAAGVQAELTGLAALERESRRPYVEWCVVLLQSTWATFCGRLAEGARLSEQAVALARAGAEDVDQEYAVQRLALAQQRWRPEEAGRAALSAYAARYADLPVWTAMLAAAAWDEGRPDEAREAIEAVDRDGFGWLAATPDGLEGCALIAPAVAGLGRRADAERLHALLLPLADRNLVIDHGWAATGPFARVLGHLAGALGRADEARAHFERAAELARRWGAPGWELRALGDAVDAGFASDALLARCLELARELELPWVAGRLVEAAQKTMP